MSDLSCFLKANAVPVENVKYVASKRFQRPVLDKNGKPVVTGKDAAGNPVYKTEPVEWEIRTIDTELDEQIRKECTKTVVTGKRGQRSMELDTDKYAVKVCVACTVFPNLNDAGLQDDYKVKGAEALLKKMLNPGEYTDYKTKVLEVNGFDVSMEELVDEAKN